MGAQPKNKITRAERGKRRAGNKPNLLKDVNVSRVPLHKQTLMKKFFNSSASGQLAKNSETEAKNTSKTVKANKANQDTAKQPLAAQKIAQAAKKAATPKSTAKMINANVAPSKPTKAKKPAAGK